ncbi:16S rRNA (guanine(966)-N(2))-methyltransferase RsmD, partial [Brachyspira hampsonii]|nr:16S rRNA (guanine(966)-N(2))-methyltransferase RsmD [Brachyspira hampsonii]
VINNIIKRNILNDNGVLAAEFGADYYKKFLDNEDFKNIVSNIMKYDIKTYGESVLIIFKYI